MMPTIGVVGGMGNEAMADLAAKLNNFSESDEYSYVFYGNSRQAFTPEEADGEWEPGDDPLLRKRETGGFTAAVLQNCGAVRAGLACNGAHPLFRDLFANLETEFVDMIAETATTAADEAGVLVLGTKRTLKKRLYDESLEAAGIATFQPTVENRSRLMDSIYNPEYGIKTGVVTQRASELLCTIISEECDRHPEIDTVVLGCTELPLALNTTSVSRLTDAGMLPDHLEFIDPTEVLAKALLSSGLGGSKPSAVSLSAYQGEHLDYHPPFTCRVDSLTMMDEFQSRLVEWSMDYFQERDAHVGGSYMHMPTLFFVDYNNSIPLDTDALDITVHEYDHVPDEPDTHVQEALRRNFEAVSHLL